MTAVTTVGDLLDYLATQPRDRPVILAKDAEGNAYSPLSEADEGYYIAESTWSGEVHFPDDEDEDEPEGALPVVLGPVN